MADAASLRSTTQLLNVLLWPYSMSGTNFCKSPVKTWRVFAWQQIELDSGLTARQALAASDEDIGGYPGGGNPAELEFRVAQNNPATGTFDISVTTPEFAGTADVNIIPATIWDTGPLETFFVLEGGAFGPSATETIKSTVPVLAETAPAWAGGDNWWLEG